jgi:hypothetical protein
MEDKPTADQVAWVFKHLKEHFEEGGSYRYLIYDRMGFSESEYGLLFDGLFLSNVGHDWRESRKALKNSMEDRKDKTP